MSNEHRTRQAAKGIHKALSGGADVTEKGDEL